ncbi:major facilitator superfamily domain-containing protein [Anaeramoeba ignava]|uniref:Lysosomal dipeptide transporter MFSD1 n=1 Tax=Anaeramoeba ignava TaxID=1746090 RepID=A0A9Q0LCQ9_ANAIG|nr:major facilitator superfamily domain-containing protein [Anaeramoeba ignava]
MKLDDKNPTIQQEPEIETELTPKTKKNKTSGCYGACSPKSPKFRYYILVLDCLLTFGSYYCFDMPSVLEDKIKSHFNINNTQYGLIYMVYAWTNCAVVLFGGVFIDKTSSRLAGLVFTLLCTIGQTFFFVGGLEKMFPLLLLGRIIFGGGLGSTTVVQSAISASYFTGKDLSFAFGVTLTVSRIGSVTNFYTTPVVESKIGLTSTLLFGAALCLVSLLDAVLFFFTDRKAEKNGIVITGKNRSRKINFKDIKTFGAQYWILSVICCLFYTNVFCLLAVLPDYLKDKFGYSNDKSSFIAGILYLVSIPSTLVAGVTVDRIGKRVWGMFTSIVIMCLFDIVLAYTRIHPSIPLVFAGMAYSIFASTLWPSICLVLEERVMGSGLGITTSVQMIGIGLVNILVGVVKDHSNYKNVMLMLLGIQIVGLILIIIVAVVDRKFNNSYLNKYVPKKKEEKEEKEEKQSLLEDSDKKESLHVHFQSDDNNDNDNDNNDNDNTNEIDNITNEIDNNDKDIDNNDKDIDNNDKDIDNDQK